MYTATRFSGNFPNRLQIACKDPFSQNLRNQTQGKTLRAWAITHSKMMYKNSRVLKNPLYLTMFGC